MPLPFLAAALFKGSALLLLAWLAAAALRSASASASARHFVWLSAILALLLLPATLLLAPSWQPAPASVLQPLLAAGRTVVTVTATEARPVFNLPAWLAGAWAAVALLLLARTLFFQLRAARLGAALPVWRLYRGLPVALSPRIGVPVLCGLRRPVIVLPEQAASWPPGRLDAVLRHEAAHAFRRDPLSQFAARLACSLYWPLPWVWAAARRLAVEAELACDDGVLRSGSRPSDYATHLIDIVRGLPGRGQIPQGGIPMARLSDLEHRLHAMFSSRANRLPAGPRFMLAVATAALALLIPIAAFDTPLLALSDGISGVVKDPSGAVVPRARVSILFADNSRKEVLWTNPAGEFTAAPLPDGDYTVSVEKPGFAALRLTGIPVGPGHSGRLELTLQTGSVRETVNVVGEGTPAVKPVSGTGVPGRIRVGGNLQATKMVEQVRPVYPPECKAQGIQGTVVLRAIIGKDGSILNLEPLNKFVDERLVQSALDAVGKWKYQPTLLNGNPVEVVTEIDVNYTLAQ